MKKQLLLIGFFSILLFSCKKEEHKYQPLASLNVAAAVISGGNVKLNSNERDSARINSFRAFTIQAGNNPVRLYPTNDPSVSYYNDVIDAADSDMYSLFLCGQAPNFEHVLVKENLPNFYTDSVVGIRVINLSPNSTPVNITLQSASTTNVFTNVAYKQLSDFVKFPMATNIPSGSISFQVRNGTTNALLTTYTLPTSVSSTYPGVSISLARFRNLTLVIKGLMGTTSGANAFAVFPMANY